MKEHGYCWSGKALHYLFSASYIYLVLVFLMIHLMRRWVKNSQCCSKKFCRTEDGIIKQTECKCSECAINFCAITEWVMFATV